MLKSATHVLMLLQKSLSGLNIQPQRTYVDLTFGGGGHARAILTQLTPSLFLVWQPRPCRTSLPPSRAWGPFSGPPDLPYAR